MSILNEKTEVTKKIIHLMITNKCARNCNDCCNKLYSINEIPIVTTRELMECDALFLTGGEPFLYARPNSYAEVVKAFFPNIKKVIVYTNAIELRDYLDNGNKIDFIDGVTVSIKGKADFDAFTNIRLNENINKLSSNRLYVFNEELVPKEFGNFYYMPREWKSVEKDEWRPSPDSIFRRLITVGE